MAKQLSPIAMPGTEAPRDRIAEAWRFPIIHRGGVPALAEPDPFDDYNEVTFIYAGADASIDVFMSLCASSGLLLCIEG